MSLYTELIHVIRKKGWYDWAYFKRYRYEQSTPTRIMMIIDLTDAEIFINANATLIVNILLEQSNLSDI